MVRVPVAVVFLCLALSCGQPRTIPEIVAEFGSAPLERRVELTRELRLLGTDGWLRLLQNEADNYPLHVVAAAELGRMGAAGAPAVPALIGFLRKGYPGMKSTRTTVAERFKTKDAGREPAREALASIGVPAIPALRELLVDEDGPVRQEAALTLGQIGSAAAPAVPDLLKRFADPDKAVVTAAAWALGQIQVADDQVSKTLAAALMDPEPLVRFESLRALGILAAVDQREAVRGLVGDVDPDVRQMALEVLEQLPVKGGSGKK